MGAVLEGWTSFNRAIMNKAMYAAVFLGLCAVVLLVHTQVNPSEETDMASKEVVDPFLANLEAHVIAKAQRRLRQRAMANRRKKHISNARAAMKTMLLNAANDAQESVHQEEIREAKKAQAMKKKKAATKGKQTKQFTWAQLQRGEDKAKENYANQKMGNLLNKLKSAPKADKKKRLHDAEKQNETKSTVMAKALAEAKAKASADAKKHDDDDDDFE